MCIPEAQYKKNMNKLTQESNSKASEAKQLYNRTKLWKDTATFSNWITKPIADAWKQGIKVDASQFLD